MGKRLLKYQKDNKEYNIRIEFGLFFRNAKIFVNDQEMHRFSSSKEFRIGTSFNLDNADQLSVRLLQNMSGPYVEVLVNNSPINGSDTSPEVRIKNAYYMLIFVCIVNLIFGYIGTFAQNRLTFEMGVGEYNLLLGISYFICLLTGFNSKSFYPLFIGASLYVCDTIFTLYFMTKGQSQVNPATMVIMRMMFLTVFFFGIKEGFREKFLKSSGA